jgi:hypothetical protein
MRSVADLTIRLPPLCLELLGDTIDLTHGKLTTTAELRSDFLFRLASMSKSQNRRFLFLCRFLLSERSEEFVAFGLQRLACDFDTGECAADSKSIDIESVLSGQYEPLLPVIDSIHAQFIGRLDFLIEVLLILFCLNGEIGGRFKLLCEAAHELARQCLVGGGHGRGHIVSLVDITSDVGQDVRLNLKAVNLQRNRPLSH